MSDFDDTTESASEPGAPQYGGSDDSEDEFDVIPASAAAPPLPSTPHETEPGEVAPVPAPWRGDEGLGAVVWERLVEFDALTPAMCFAAALSSDACDVFPLGDAQTDAIFLFKTPENLLGKMMVKQVAPSRLRVMWVVENTIFPSAKLRPYAEGDIEVDLVLHSTEGDRLRSFVDLSMGGFAWDSRTFRQVQKKRTADSPGHCLPPDVGFFLRARREGGPTPFLQPCRGTLLHAYAPHPRLLSLNTHGLDAAGAYLSNAEADANLARMYKGLFRDIAATTHFLPHQIEQVWGWYVGCCENGAEDVAAKVDVLMQLEDLPGFLAKVFPVDDFVPEAAPGEEEETEAFKAMVAGFLGSEAFVEGVWWLLSDPIASGYKAMSPDSKRLNRVIHFPRVLEVLNVAMFGTKEAITELIVQLIIHNRPTITRSEFAAFFKSAFPTEDADGLAGLFDAQFEKDLLCVAHFRYSLLTQMDVFGTWNGLILPFMQGRGWSRCNPDL
eukprot:TRINITY_DN17037_c0_g1_i1.p1 TRINITY_DN17037_c0_g1~~TRINITY_DN17037_c0_g1_i1.p1  ORF type:complete len:497 (+),score=156.87 TRINITY_DN17037_c0_g1_i1:53-1543(+)